MNIETVETYYRQHRETFIEPFRLRVHRSLSWLKKAEAAEDLDTRFMTLWIAFNAAYAKELQEDFVFGDRSGFREFLQTVCRFDQEKALYDLVWRKFSGSIRTFLDNKFVFQPFWDFHNGKISESVWQDAFAKSKNKAHQALAVQDTDDILAVLFDRLYTLRNQVIHGGSTFNSSANRIQLKDACAILTDIIPLFLQIMQQNHSHPVWGKPFYPMIRED